MAQGDIYTVNVEVAQQGNSYFMSFAYEVESATTNDNCEELAKAWNVTPKLALRDILADDSQVGCIIARKFDPKDSPPFHLPLDNNIGLAGSDGLPYNTTAILLIRTDGATSREDGLVQVSGLTESFVVGGQLSSVFRAGDGQAFIDAIDVVTDALATVYNVGVISKILNGVPRVPPIFNKFNQILWNPEMRSRRTRTSKLTGAVP